jgi:hypothetical protein
VDNLSSVSAVATDGTVVSIGRALSSSPLADTTTRISNPLLCITTCAVSAFVIVSSNRSGSDDRRSHVDRAEAKDQANARRLYEI